MKKKNLMFGIILIAAFLMILPVNAVASPYSGAWTPNDGDIFSFELTPASNTSYSFYLYDWTTTPNISNDLLLFSDGTYSGTTVYFTQVSTTWYAGLTSGAQTLNLGSSNQFGLYFYNNSTSPTSYNSSYDRVTITLNEAYVLTDDQSGANNTNMIVSISDVSPVPIPATIWIFGAGLVGLVGVRRKLKN